MAPRVARIAGNSIAVRREVDAKSKVDQEFTQAKAELIRIRIAEKQKVLMQTDEAMEVAEKLIGTMLRTRSTRGKRQ